MKGLGPQDETRIESSHLRILIHTVHGSLWTVAPMTADVHDRGQASTGAQWTVARERQRPQSKDAIRKTKKHNSH